MIFLFTDQEIKRPQKSYLRQTAFIFSFAPFAARLRIAAASRSSSAEVSPEKLSRSTPSATASLYPQARTTRL